MILERSLTVLLPTRNAQTTLAATVDAVLDIASDMTDRLELLIIDDGSKDATQDVALELARCYPQIRLMRHAVPQGRDAAIRLGLSQCRGELVYTVEPGSNALVRVQRTFRPTRPNFLSRPRTIIREGV
jgi:glycosyltransferase involved in cell wall biosynthesis